MRALRNTLAVTLVSALCACVSTRIETNPPRGATEQLLLSEAAERALADLPLPDVDGRPVAVEVAGLGPGGSGYDDLAYVGAALRERMAQAGARIVEPEEAELIAVVRVGAFGTFATSSQFGIPAISLPPLVTPNIPFVRRSRQRGYAKLRLVTYGKEGTLVESAGPSFHRTHFDTLSILFLEFPDQDLYPSSP